MCVRMENTRGMWFWVFLYGVPLVMVVGFSLCCVGEMSGGSGDVLVGYDADGIMREYESGEIVGGGRGWAGSEESNRQHWLRHKRHVAQLHWRKSE